MTEQQMNVYTAGEWTPQERAAYIMEPAHEAVAKWIEHSRRMDEQADATPHGEWQQVVAQLPYAEASIRMIRAIHRNVALGESVTSGNALPDGWRTLYVLSRVPADDLADLIDRGEIHAEMTRADAQAIADQYNAARIADLNAYSALMDATTSALALANDRQAWPEDLPDQYQPPAVGIERARSLLTRWESL